MTIIQLELIKKVYLDIEKGISIPNEINIAYSYIPDLPNEVPMRAKLRAITRYYMLLWNDIHNNIINSLDQTSETTETTINQLLIEDNNEEFLITDFKNNIIEENNKIEDNKIEIIPKNFLTKQENVEIKKKRGRTKFTHNKTKK